MPTKAERDATAKGRTGIIAGGGALPRLVAERLVEAGERPFVLSIVGEGSKAGAVAGVEADEVALEDMGSVVGRLKAHGVDRVVLAGTILRRPAFRDIRWSIGFLKMLASVLRALARGDDGALRNVIGHLESQGLEVVAAHQVAPDLLAETGAITRAAPAKRDKADIEAARAAALAIGRLDIGQAAIAVGGRAVALEGVEGTDGLLERMIALRGHGRLAGKAGGVLAKLAKPGQELRADLPAIGPQTVTAAHAAGLAGIAVEAGRSLILDRAETVEAADRLGIFILGLEPEDER
ncbi:MAG: UDP-2,3-diacylglucosamine diphosphatase LpxI [Rhizobiaceae bacterium]|nr:UDP-2,3-diacylglucosamine diphosphatase LpxI [Rhizobiaceae bacterium]MCV0407194.1 UDP-2,3-diacylglucosamine diphosphatase LpxI [Rhizobiaceae bacterium]